jgi:hypothetical protein
VSVLSALARLLAKTFEIVVGGLALLIGTVGLVLGGTALVVGGLSDGGGDELWFVLVGVIMLAIGLGGTWFFSRAVLEHRRELREWRERPHDADEPAPPGFFDL